MRGLNFSLLCPTRERPVQARTFVESVFKTATYPEQVEVLFYVDQDDPKTTEYTQRIGSIGGALSIALHFGVPQGVGRAWNELASIARGSVLLMANDDQIYRTMGWDTRLEEVVAEYPDDIYCAWFNDGIHITGGHCAFPIISRKWYETLGYFVPTEFKFFYHDTWIMDLARQIGRLRYIPEVFVEHMHHVVRKAPVDSTYARNLGLYAEDGATFRKTEPIRQQHAQKLLEVLTDWTPS